MRGSAAFRAAVAPGGVLAGPWVRNELWRGARAVPSLDLRFAENKSLVDATTGANLVTFTRASSGTFVGSDGVIKTATTNLLLRSEDFSATWSLNNLLAFGSGSTVDAAVAPNGAITADLIVENSSNTTHGISQTFSIVSGNAYTGSVYLKTASRTWAYLQFDGNLWAESGSRPRVWVNLSTGQLGSSDRNSGVSIANVGNGWYRVTLTATANTSATSSFNIALTTADANFSSYTGDGSSGIYLWGAQLEQSPTVGEYIPTTSTINSAPRFDHNPTTGESLGLLVEEQRTNLQTNSENIASLGTLAGSTVTSNITLAPDGQTTADKLVEDTSTGGHQVSGISIAWAGNTTYTVSVYAKADTRTQLTVAFGTSSNWVNSSRTATFNLANGTISSQSIAPLTASIQALSNGWYRCVVSATTAASPVASTLVLQLNNGVSASYTGDGTSGLFLWGAQLEAGAFPTSYIPTTTATATRSADVASITGANFSSWYRQDEGSFFCSTFAPKGTVVYGTGDTFDNTQYINVGSSSNVSIRSGGAITAALTAPVSTTALTNIAHGYVADNFAAVSNGGAISTDMSGAVPLTQVRLTLGSSAWNTTGSNSLNGIIRRLTYWPSRLPNTTLQEITQ